jgi:hypothetical protein
MVIATVTEAQARQYEKQAWHLGCGVKPILDNTTMRFATDFANVCIKSLIASLYGEIRNQVIAEIRAVAREKASGAPPTKAQGEIYVAPSAPQKGQIVLTD